MSNQLTSNAEALRLFFTEDIYLIPENNQNALINDKFIASEVSTDQVEVPVVKPNLMVENVNVPVEMPALVKDVPQQKEQNEIEFKYLGKNNKNILILVNDELNDVSTLEGRELLRNLVKAINLTANDFALVNYAQYKNSSFEAFKTFFNCTLVLSFGVEANLLGLPNQPYHQLVSHKTDRLIFTHNLHDLDGDQQSKKMLWASLQQLK